LLRGVRVNRRRLGAVHRTSGGGSLFGGQRFDYRRTAAGQPEERVRRRLQRAVRTIVPRPLRAGPLPSSRGSDAGGPLSPRARLHPGPLSRPQLLRPRGARVQAPSRPPSGRLPVGGEHVPDRDHDRTQTGAGASGAPDTGARYPAGARRGSPTVPGARQPAVSGAHHQTRAGARGPTVSGDRIQTVPGASVPAGARGRGRRQARRPNPGRPRTVDQVSGSTTVVVRTLARVRPTLPPRVSRSALPPRVSRSALPSRRVLSPTIGGRRRVRRDGGRATADAAPRRLLVPATRTAAAAAKRGRPPSSPSRAHDRTGRWLPVADD